jgi:signal transduction histidine kinase
LSVIDFAGPGTKSRVSSPVGSTHSRLSVTDLIYVDGSLRWIYPHAVPEVVVDFRLLFEESSDVLLVLLPDAPRFTIVGATRARLLATHTTPDQFGRGLFEMFPDNPDDPSATGTANLRASLERVLATRAADTMAVQKYDIRGPDGTFEARYWSPKNLPVLSSSGEVLYILHRVEDVTELVRATELGDELRGRTREMEREVVSRSRELAAANEELREANAKLGQLDAAKTAFFSNVSHEFRTPLTLMLGPLEDLLADASPDDRRRSLLTLAHDNALRLLKLVNALLDFSRFEAGRLTATFAPLDIAAFTAELAGMFESAAARAGLRLVVDCPPLSEPGWVDRDMWEKVVTNLLSNAFKFTPRGEIAVRVGERGDRILMEVADTGVGIPELELPRIFERFHRVASTWARTHEGTGIGLSLARELVELHGGRVTVKSLPGQGTTFTVEIPKGYSHLPADAVSHTPADPRISRDAIAHVAEAGRWAGDVRAASGGGPPPAAAPSASRPRVLVVDDNRDLRSYVAGLLAPAYEVATSEDGLAALQAIQGRRPDIVVSDVMMPRLDGFGLVRELRGNPATASLPIILLSARAGEEAAIEGLDVGADDYLAKPFSARELLARVRTHVDLARARRAWAAELERTNRELDAFSYSVSHDLRAPLRAIDGFSSMLEKDSGEELSERGRHHLARIRGGVARMSELIEDLLGLAKISRAALTRQPVDITMIARKVASELAARPQSRAVDVRIEEGLSADADRRLATIVLEHLIGNAWKFTGKQDHPRIEVGRASAAGRAFFVRDNGAGFDMAYAERLFGAFQRLHTEAEFEGTGIGLATVQRIVRRHNGRIWAEGEPGKGATFYFTFEPDHDGEDTGP